MEEHTHPHNELEWLHPVIQINMGRSLEGTSTCSCENKGKQDKHLGKGRRG